MIQNQEPAKKRSKLVLPEPQITDSELQQVVKVGRASEIAKEMVSESGVETTDTLLNDYSTITTNNTASTPRTPAAFTDRVMQEAQNIMALTNVDTPLKGGTNVPLHDIDFSSSLPQAQTLATPNTVLATPFRSIRGVEGTPGGFSTPSSMSLVHSNGDKSGNTVIRDKLMINAEEALDVGSTPAEYKQYQQQVKYSLKESLLSLPTPKNDYEIVVPEQDIDTQITEEKTFDHVKDQADVDAATLAQTELKRAQEFALRSLVIQRALPRPHDINMTVLRPTTEMQGLSNLQVAEEQVKQEMVSMLHYDALLNPITQSIPNKKNNINHAQYLEQNKYENISKHDLDVAKKMLQEEIQIVKTGMAHGELSFDAYTQVWDECLKQVLYLPSQNRYTRANLASKKDRIESAEKKLEQNRKHMAKEAKRCGKIEKKLKVLTGGYQARHQALLKQFIDTCEQIEQSSLALSTFRYLAAQEEIAIPKRIESLTEDVSRQTEREKVLQEQFAKLKTEKSV